jgi:hypothetical protein
MVLTLNVLDIRGHTPQQALSELKQRSGQIDEKSSMWLINDSEPKDCYSYLMEHNFYFRTFIVSKNEYRVFISRNEC